MGYYSAFDITTKKIDGQFITVDEVAKIEDMLDKFGVKFAFEDGIVEPDGSAYFGCKDMLRWNYFSEDMITLSTALPSLVFRLHVEGDNNGDLWDGYYHNGEEEICRAIISYPDPVTIKWSDRTNEKEEQGHHDWKQEYWQNDECLYRDIDYVDEDEDDTNPHVNRFEIVFDHDGTRYYCFIDAIDMNQALSVFFRNHGDVCYRDIVDHLEI